MKLKLRQTTAMARRSFLKSAGLAALGAAVGSKAGQALLAALPDDPEGEGRRLVGEVARKAGEVVRIGVDYAMGGMKFVVMVYDKASDVNTIVEVGHGESLNEVVSRYHDGYKGADVEVVAEESDCDREGTHVHPAEGFGGAALPEDPYQCVRCGAEIS